MTTARGKARAKAMAKAVARATALARATARAKRTKAKDRAKAMDGRTDGRTELCIYRNTRPCIMLLLMEFHGTGLRPMGTPNKQDNRWFSAQRSVFPIL